MDKSSPQYQKYQHYLKSLKWRFKRWLKLRQVGYKCQRCGSRKRLECHHLHYRTLGNEAMVDLAIYCHDCHIVADQIRAMETGRNTYMTKRHGEGWQSRFTILEATEEFKQWLKTKNPQSQ